MPLVLVRYLLLVNLQEPAVLTQLVYAVVYPVVVVAVARVAEVVFRLPVAKIVAGIYKEIIKVLSKSKGGDASESKEVVDNRSIRKEIVIWSDGI